MNMLTIWFLLKLKLNLKTSIFIYCILSNTCSLPTPPIYLKDVVLCAKYNKKIHVVKYQSDSVEGKLKKGPDVDELFPWTNVYTKVWIIQMVFPLL